MFELLLFINHVYFDWCKKCENILIIGEISEFFVVTYRIWNNAAPIANLRGLCSNSIHSFLQFFKIQLFLYLPPSIYHLFFNACGLIIQSTGSVFKLVERNTAFTCWYWRARKLSIRTSEFMKIIAIYLRKNTSFIYSC